jgi:hypothetical protein
VREGEHGVYFLALLDPPPAEEVPARLPVQVSVSLVHPSALLGKKISKKKKKTKKQQIKPTKRPRINIQHHGSPPHPPAAYISPP